MHVRLKAAAVSDIGVHRTVNQDAAFVAPWGAGVADGVGGGPAGDIASAALVHRMLVGSRDALDAAQLVTRVRIANWDLAAQVRRDPALDGMATTFTALWLSTSGGLLLAHTGDSRGYLLRDGRMTRQTRDDSLVQALVDQGVVQAEDAGSHPQRNIITASLRGHAADPVRVVDLPTRVGDRWLLCSDGVSDYVPEPDLAGLLADGDDPQETARRIVALALEAGTRDNVTAVVCDVVEAIDEWDERAPYRRATFSGAAQARFNERLTDLESA